MVFLLKHVNEKLYLCECEYWYISNKISIHHVITTECKFNYERSN